jgi:hypothetical protein
MLEETKLHAVFLESSDISGLNSKCLDAFVAFKFKRSLRSAILYLTENLHKKDRVLNRAPIIANLLIGNVYLADIALVLDFDKVDIDYDAAYLHNVSDDVIGLNSFKESQLRISLEVTYLVLDLTNYLNISGIKLHLSIHVKFV